MTHQSVPTNDQPDTAQSKVGYKHPPVKNQFRKGQGGNPRGRGKGQRNLKTVLDEVLRQTVTVTQEGKSQRMSKGEALIQMLLNKARQNDSRATKAVLELTEQIGRIQTAEKKIGGRRGYEFMLIPGMAASQEQWESEIATRKEDAAFRKEVQAYLAKTGHLPTRSQAEAYKISLAEARADTRPGIRRPLWRTVESLEESKSEAAAPPPTPTPP
jgi:Family of unknown function (DUF5681)